MYISKVQQSCEPAIALGSLPFDFPWSGDDKYWVFGGLENIVFLSWEQKVLIFIAEGQKILI